MKFSAQDFKALRWALVGLLLALIVGVGAGWGSYVFLDKSQKERRAAMQERAESQGKLTRATSEEQELREKIALYQALMQRGRIGKENRLDWVEQIARISSQRKLGNIDYEFSPQKPVDALLLPGAAVAGKQRFMTSTQRLSLQLLHEGDLLGLLDELRQTSSALILVRECSLLRLPAKPDRRALDPQLAAECQLEWITLQEAA